MIKAKFFKMFFLCLLLFNFLSTSLQFSTRTEKEMDIYTSSQFLTDFNLVLESEEELEYNYSGMTIHFLRSDLDCVFHFFNLNQIDFHRLILLTSLLNLPPPSVLT